MIIFSSSDMIRLQTDAIGLSLALEEFYPQGGTAKKKVHWVAFWEYENSDGVWEKSDYGFDSMWIDDALEMLMKAKELLTVTS